MRKLLQDIAEGELDYEQDSRFMNEEICDADFSLKIFILI